MLINIINLLFTVTLFGDNNTHLRSLKNVTVTQGIYSDRIIVEWEKKDGVTFTVTRSDNKTNGFVTVAQTSDPKFEDITVERGVRYWYKVLPSAETDFKDEAFISDEEYNSITEPVYTDPDLNKSGLNNKEKISEEKSSSETKDTEKGTAEKNSNEIKKEGEAVTQPPVLYSGYTSIEKFTGIKLEALIKLKKEKLKPLKDPEEKKKREKHLDYIKEHYMNPVKLTLFMTMAKPYFNRGDLIIVNDGETFEINKDLNKVVFYGRNYSYMAVFESGKFMSIISGTEEKDLVDTLLKNSELYCVASGKKFIVDKNGITRLVNSFDAVGLSTGYLKNDSEWRSRTIMTATSRSDLKEMMKRTTKSE